MQTGKDENGEDGKSKLNRVEAELVVDLVRKFIRAGDVKLKDIGVITPYKAQVLRCFSFVYRNNAVTPGTEARGDFDFYHFRVPLFMELFHDPIQATHKSGYRGMVAAL